MNNIHRPISNIVKESVDNLPSGIAFFGRQGEPVLCNRQMYRLVFALTGCDLQSLSELRGALASLPESSEVHKEGEVFLLPDGSAWKFSFTEIENESGPPYTQAVASDVTDLYYGSRELAESNEQLKEMAKNLKRMADNVVAIMREEEILSMKMRVHNEVGSSMLQVRRFYLAGCPPEEKETLVRSLKKTVALLHNEIGQEDRPDAYGELLSVAESIGAGIELTGEMPRSRDELLLLVAALRECLTNTIRHAGGSKLYVNISRNECGTTAEIRNDGRPPAGEITEGGGLSALRKRIENAGGTMRVQSRPEFVLTVCIPPKGEETR